jgi:hypothetical protein
VTSSPSWVTMAPSPSSIDGDVFVRNPPATASDLRYSRATRWDKLMHRRGEARF